MKVDRNFDIIWKDGREHLVITFTLDHGNGVRSTIQQELTYHETVTLRYDLDQARKQRDAEVQLHNNKQRVKDIRWEDEHGY